MADYNEQIQAALVDVVEDAPIRNEDILTLSNGVVLRRKPLPRTRIMALVEKFPLPPIPEVYNKEKGKMEKWDGSEEYQKAKQKVEMNQALAMIDLIIASGLEVVSIPDSVPPIEDDEWIEELELSHISVKKDSKVVRRFSWIKFVAAKDEDNLEKIMTFATSQLAESEANVAQQLQENFPDN